jgi:hypothetical protein
MDTSRQRPISTIWKGDLEALVIVPAICSVTRIEKKHGQVFFKAFIRVFSIRVFKNGQHDDHSRYLFKTVFLSFAGRPVSHFALCTVLPAGHNERHKEL